MQYSYLNMALVLKTSKPQAVSNFEGILMT